MVTKKLTPNQQAWQKELRRLKQFIRRAKKRGYTFDENVIPETPKKITQKRLSEIRGIKPDTLYAQAEFFNPDTGETISGTAGRTFERKRSAKKGQLTRAIRKAQESEVSLPQQSSLILQNIRDILNQFTPSSRWSNYWVQKKENDKNQLENLLNSTIAQDGEYVVADRLQNYAGDIERILNSVMYGSDEEQVQFDMVEFATILKGRSLTQQEASDLTDLMEMQETE